MQLLLLTLLLTYFAYYSQAQQQPAANGQQSNQQFNNSLQYDNSLTSNETGLQSYGATGQLYRNGQISTYQDTQFANQQNSTARLQQYSFNNGQCYYEDDAVVENGERRELTEDELNRLKQFEDNMANYSKQISASLGDWVRSLLQWDPVDNHDTSFPNFSPFPTMPTVPCFCTSCNQTQQ